MTPCIQQKALVLQQTIIDGVGGIPNAVAQNYMHSLQEHPLYTKMATGGILATCGDAIAQKRGEEPYDVGRAASFMGFDMIYRAGQHVSFPWIVDHCQGQYFTGLLLHVVPSTQMQSLPVDSFAAMEQTLASQLGIVPFFYYPVFFSLTGFLQGLTASQALERAQEKFLPLMKRNLLFWIPVQFVQFGFIPTDLQIPFLSAAGLCWTFILSAFAGNASAATKSTGVQTIITTEEDETTMEQKSRKSLQTVAVERG